MAGTERHTFIIAEAGVNHNGNPLIAATLAGLAKTCGADAVKFQTFFGSFPDLKKYEFAKETWRNVFSACNEIGIEWMSTPFDFESIEFLASLGMKRWKIPSGMATNRVYLKAVADAVPEGGIVYASTGMCTIDEARELESYFDNVVMLHCVSEYPCKPETINLSAMLNFKRYGYSDHSRYVDIPIAAVAMGAEVIESHLTLSKKMDGPDHKASLEYLELSAMVLGIRLIEKVIGDGFKQPTEAELKIKDAIRERMSGALLQKVCHTIH